MRWRVNWRVTVKRKWWGSPSWQKGEGTSSRETEKRGRFPSFILPALANLHSGFFGLRFPSETASCQFRTYRRLKAGSRLWNEHKEVGKGYDRGNKVHGRHCTRCEKAVANCTLHVCWGKIQRRGVVWQRKSRSRVRFCELWSNESRSSSSVIYLQV